MEEYVMEYHGQEITFTEEWFGTEEKKYYFNKITSVEHIDGEEPIFKFLYDGSWMQIIYIDQRLRRLMQNIRR